MVKARIDALNKTLATYSTQKNTLETAKSRVFRPTDKAAYDKQIANLEILEKELISKRDALLYPSLDSQIKDFISKNPEYTYEEASKILQEMLTNPKK